MRTKHDTCGYGAIPPFSALNCDVTKLVRHLNIVHITEDVLQVLQAPGGGK
jgi:hypothetical protein